MIVVALKVADGHELDAAVLALMNVAFFADDLTASAAVASAASVVVDWSVIAVAPEVRVSLHFVIAFACGFADLHSGHL